MISPAVNDVSTWNDELDRLVPAKWPLTLYFKSYIVRPLVNCFPLGLMMISNDLKWSQIFRFSCLLHSYIDWELVFRVMLVKSFVCFFFFFFSQFSSLGSEIIAKTLCNTVNICSKHWDTSAPLEIRPP